MNIHFWMWRMGKQLCVTYRFSGVIRKNKKLGFQRLYHRNDLCGCEPESSITAEVWIESIAKKPRKSHTSLNARKRKSSPLSIQDAVLLNLYCRLHAVRSSHNFFQSFAFSQAAATFRHVKSSNFCPTICISTGCLIFSLSLAGANPTGSVEEDGLCCCMVQYCSHANRPSEPLQRACITCFGDRPWHSRQSRHDEDIVFLQCDVEFILSRKSAIVSTWDRRLTLIFRNKFCDLACNTGPYFSKNKPCIYTFCAPAQNESKAA